MLSQAQVDSVRVPTSSSKIWKEECAFSFANQESEGGILVDMNSFIGFSPKYALVNYNRTKHPVYLRINRKRVPKATLPDNQPKPSSVAAAVMASMEDTFELKYTFAVVVLPNFDVIPYPSPDLPQKVQQAVEAIINANSQEHVEAVKPIDGTLRESKYAKELVQLNNGKQHPHEGWKCDSCGGDATTNLWLNLSDGYIGCGRKNPDGTGGQGHAEAHYRDTGFPLVVKLGTITGSEADVWSYAENDMVIDPFLKRHLGHFGINTDKLKKTDKTVAELELEYNMSFDWSRVQEKDKDLIPLQGPGFTGIQNLGNTCYMASILQVTFSLSEFVDHYYKNLKVIYESADYNDIPRDFHVQMAKLGHGLLSGEYQNDNNSSSSTSDSAGSPPVIPQVKPAMLKSLIGEGHREFATSKQQDAHEFFQYLMDLIKRKEKARQSTQDPSKVFEIELEERLQCSSSKKVRYASSSDIFISLPIPIHKANNLPQVEEYNKRQAEKSQTKQQQQQQQEPVEVPVWPNVKLLDCIEEWGSPEMIMDWYSPAIKGKTAAIKQKRIRRFPKYLALHMIRFVLKGQQLAKLDAFIDVPDELDLRHLAATGQQPDEQLLPDDSPAIQFDEAVIATIMAMGFSRTKAEHAAFNTKGQGPDAAAEWLFLRMDDPELEKPLKVQPKQASQPTQNVSEESIANLMAMGFTRSHCIKALENTQGNIERALDWLFSHPDSDEDKNQKTTQEAPHTQYSGRYKLVAFVTHMGKNTDSGHYVAHIRQQVGNENVVKKEHQIYGTKEEKWVIYNDSKVAISQDPPKDMAYIYFYQAI